jgi:hypothetical protein
MLPVVFNLKAFRPQAKDGRAAEFDIVKVKETLQVGFLYYVAD